jgi:serine protease Do
MHLSAIASSFLRRSGQLLVGLLVMATASTCYAQAGLLSPDARRDTELRPGVVRVIIRLTASFRGLTCKTGVAGTGFLYRPDGYLITNGHVAQIANEKDEDALIAQRKIAFDGCMLEKVERAVGQRLGDRDQEIIFRGMKVTPELTVVLDNGAPYDGEIKAYSDPITSGGKDVAIIKIDANNLPTVPIGDSDAVNVNDRVYVIGYPGAADISNSSALVATSSDGIISAVKSKDASDTPLLQTNANINHGNSGGPAFNAAGEVIGIATFGKEVPGYNFLVPISTAKEFIRQAGAEPMRGNFDKVWHQALDAYVDQDWGTAHKLLSDVLEMMPNQPEAQKLQLQAAANERAETPIRSIEKKMGVGGLVALGVVVIVLAAVLIWLLVRKPAQQPIPAPAYKPSVQPSVAAAGGSSAVTLTATKLVPATPPSKAALSSAPGEQSYGSLIVSGGPMTGNRFPVTKAGLTIGRDPAKCTVVLSDDSISKEHAWIVPVENGVAVIDRNSANGTYVNSTDSPRINKVVLRHGDRVYLGKTSPTVFTYYSS